MSRHSISFRFSSDIDYIVVILILLTLFLSTLTAVEYSGVILDSVTNDPLPGCIIDNNMGLSVTSDVTGRFFIQLPEYDIPDSAKHNPGILTISHPNYHNRKIKVTESFQPLIIRLDPVIYPFKQINVIKEIHNYKEIGFRTGSYILNSVQIESSNSTAEAINQLPGIITKSYGGPAGISTVSLLGGQANRIAILLDGVLLNNEQNGSADISQIPHNLLENMNFYPQGASARFGSSAMTGVINLKPKTGETFYSHRSGSYNHLEDMIQFSHKWTRMSTSTSFGRQDYQGNYIWNEKGIRYDYFENEISQIFYYLNNRVILQDSIIIKAQLLDITNSRRLSGYIYSGPDLADMNDRLQIISAKIVKSPFSLNLNRKLSTIDYENPAIPAPPVSAHHRLKTSDFIFRMNSQDLGYQFMLRDENSKSTNSIDTSRIIISSILEMTHKVSKFEMIASFRAEFERRHHGLFAGEWTLNFRIGSWWEQSSLTFSNNYKRPGFNDLYWIPFGNPELKVERSVNLNLRNKFNIYKSSLKLNLFFIKYDDLIQWTPANTGTVWSPENIPTAESGGYGLYWEYQSNPSFRVSVSLLKNDTYFHSSINDDVDSKSLRYSPEYIFSLNHSSYFHGFILVTDYKYVSEQIYFYDHPADRTIPGYGLINIGLSKTIRTNFFNFLFTFTVHNLNNLQYQTIHGYPEPGRSFSFKSTITLK